MWSNFIGVEPIRGTQRLEGEHYFVNLYWSEDNDRCLRKVELSMLSGQMVMGYFYAKTDERRVISSGHHERGMDCKSVRQRELNDGWGGYGCIFPF